MWCSKPSTRASAQAGSAVGLIERDLEAEFEARKELLSKGFRFEQALNGFVARGEAALVALDPRGGAFPDSWVIDRGASAPTFRRDLSLRTQVQLVPDSGMVELRFGVERLDDDATVAALIEMQDLIAWLDSGERYVRLADGSYVAPSPRFRKSLAIAHDLGATGDRALVSPLCVGLLRAMGDSAAVELADAATSSWVQEVSGLGAPASVDPPSELSATLRDYQKRGLDWLAMLHRYRLTGILADDMGLGKTVQTLALLLKVRESEGPKASLVVAPTSVLSVWRDEAARFAPTLRVGIWHGDPEERKQLKTQELDLIVTSYGILRRDAEHLAPIGFRYVILDEAQSAKNAATQNARAVRRLKSERRLALTGTPIENRPEELWATFDFLAPGFLGSLRNFRKRYARPIDRGEDQPLGLLRARIHPFVMRRLKDEVAKELPPKLESTVRCEMLPAQRALYDHLAGELKDSVRQKIAKVGIERAHMDILAALTRLRQICCDPSLLPAPPGAKVPESAKLALFTELMREALESERRVLVFSQFVEMQKRLIKAVQSLGVEPLWLHGGTRNRDKVVASFQDPEGPPVLIVSLKAGGTGLTLTRADTVMHYDPWWNPAVERQATDRAHRLGQQHQVTVYKLVCARSIEERVLEMAARKDELAGALLGSEGAGQKRISAEEIMQLFG
jgi:SNF2 family DNA or RNA helicase